MKHIRGTWLHRRLGDRLFSTEMWQPERFRFASGFSIGVFFGMIPFPAQMLSAALIAYLARVNIPAAVAATWTSNPLTTPFFMFIQYKIGVFLLGHGEMNVDTSDWLQLLKRAPLQLLVGSFVLGGILSLLSYPLCIVGWDWVTKRFLQPKPRLLKKPPVPPGNSV
jgi:uncharacterized protein